MIFIWITIIAVLICLNFYQILDRIHVFEEIDRIDEWVRQIASGKFDQTYYHVNDTSKVKKLEQSISLMERNLYDAFHQLKNSIDCMENQKEIISGRNRLKDVQIGETVIINQKLEQLASLDQLTGIYNRRYFINKLESELLVASNRQLPLSVIMIDIDLFKKINDRYGHLVGDQVLKEFAGVVKLMARQSDAFARYGGEEFVFLLPDTDRTGALALAEKIRMAVESNTISTDSGEIQITVSLGVAELKEFDKGVLDLHEHILGEADKQLYEAKNTGRNRVCG